MYVPGPDIGVVPHMFCASFWANNIISTFLHFTCRAEKLDDTNFIGDFISTAEASFPPSQQEVNMKIVLYDCTFFNFGS